MTISVYSLPPLLGALLSAILGLFVFLHNKKSLINFVFSLVCFSIAVWLGAYAVCYSTNNVVLASNCAKTACTSVAFLSLFTYHFSVVYLGLKSEKKFVSIFYFTTFVMLLMFVFTDLLLNGVHRYFWGYYSKAGVLHPAYLAVSSYMLFRCVYLINKQRRSLSLPLTQRNQIRYLFLAVLFIIPATIDYIPKYGIEIYPFGFVFVLLFISITTFAIVKHNLLDIEIVLKETVYYSLLAFGLSLVYALTIFLAQSLFVEKFKDPYYVSSVVFICLVAIFLKPLESYFRNILDTYFFKGTISELARINTKLKYEVERRERLKSVGILAAGMAHEIKNPLTTMNTFIDYLPARYEDPEFRDKFMRIMKQEIARMRGIVVDLLSFSKPSEPVKTNCHVSEILKDVVDLLGGEFLTNHIVVKYNFDSSGVMIHVDHDQIKQVFLNIIMNAIDAMKGVGGELEIRVEKVSHGANIVVSDTGCGIEAEKLSHIFDPFYSNKDGGTGLGLAITHSILEKNSGNIEIESKIGVGTTVRVLLPCP